MTLHYQQTRIDWNELKCIQKYWFTNVKMNAFQSWMHFYTFIGIAYLAFQSKNDISFFCALCKYYSIQNFE